MIKLIRNKSIFKDKTNAQISLKMIFEIFPKIKIFYFINLFIIDNLILKIISLKKLYFIIKLELKS
jgi:hypothetical protein